MKKLTLFCLSLSGAILACGAARAGIIEDFQFNEDVGTVITSTVNSGPGAHTWLSQNTAINAGVNSGSFRIQKGGEATPVTNQVSNTFDIANVTSGKVWLVAEIAGWLYTETASSPLERLRFGFLDNTDPVAANSSTITAEMNIDRLADNSLVLSGEAGGSGAASIPEDVAMPLSRSAPLTLVLELDKDADQYSIFYKDGAAPFARLGLAPAALGASTLNAGARDGNSIRFAFTGTYSDTGEFVDVDRIYVTDMNPVPEPACCVAAILASLGLMLFRRRQG